MKFRISLLIVVLFVIYGHLGDFFEPIRPIHEWRKTDSFSIALNYMKGNSFWQPENSSTMSGEPTGLMVRAPDFVRKVAGSIPVWDRIYGLKYPYSLARNSSQCGSPGGLGDSPGLAGVLRGVSSP